MRIIDFIRIDKKFLFAFSNFFTCMTDMGMDIKKLLNMDINTLLGMVVMAMNTKSNTSIIMGMLPTTGNLF
jgi:hypothetical protein